MANVDRSVQCLDMPIKYKINKYIWKIPSGTLSGTNSNTITCWYLLNSEWVYWWYGSFNRIYLLIINIPAYGANPPCLKFKYGYSVWWIAIDGSVFTVASVGARFYDSILMKIILFDLYIIWLIQIFNYYLHLFINLYNKRQNYLILNI